MPLFEQLFIVPRERLRNLTIGMLEGKTVPT